MSGAIVTAARRGVLVEGGGIGVHYLQGLIPRLRRLERHAPLRHYTPLRGYLPILPIDLHLLLSDILRQLLILTQLQIFEYLLLIHLLPLVVHANVRKIGLPVNV